MVSVTRPCGTGATPPPGGKPSELPSAVMVHAYCGKAGSFMMVTVHAEQVPLEQVLVGVPAA